MVNLFLLLSILPIFWELYNIIAPKEMRSIRIGSQKKRFPVMNPHERLNLFSLIYYGIFRVLGLITINWPYFIALILCYPVKDLRFEWLVRLMGVIRLGLIITSLIFLLK